MSFHNDKEERGTVPPALGRQGPAFRKSGAFGKAPAFSKAAGGIMERIRGLSRRDLGLVALGLSALIMAPVAEYMMSRPPLDNTLTAGFGSRGPGGPSSIYEPGVHGLSQGSPDGSGEVIVPLSARDPLSLILGAAKPAPPPMPAAPPPGGGLRDTVRDAGREAFSAAVKSGGAPTVIPKMASGLRGMSSFFGGGESSRTSGALAGGKISEAAKSASGKSASRSMVGPVASAGYKGVAMSPNSASRGAFEKLRAQAGAAADNFTTGSAVKGLDQAAAASVNAGAGDGGLGGGKEGEKTRAPSNSSVRDQKSTSGESLAATLARKRAEKALEWEMYKQYEIPKKLIEAVLSGVGTSLTNFAKSLTDGLTGQGGGGPAPWVCLGRRDKNKDCHDPKAYLNTQIMSTSTEEKEIDSWKTASGLERICNCGTMPLSSYEKITGGGGGSPNPGKPPPADMSPVVGDLNVLLGDLTRFVNKAQRETGAKQFLIDNLTVNGLMDGAAIKYLDLVKLLNTDTDEADKQVASYGSARSASGHSVARHATVVDEFEKRVKAAAAAARKPVVGAEGGVSGFALSPDAEKELNRVYNGITDHKALIAKTNQYLTGHSAITEFYAGQSQHLRRKTGDIVKVSNDARTLAAGNKRDLEPLREKEKFEFHVQEGFVKTFNGMVGDREPAFKPSALSRTPADIPLYAMVVPADLRDSVGLGGEMKPVDALISFRGAKSDKLWKDHKVDDSQAINEENARWRAVSPETNYLKIISGESWSTDILLPVNVVDIRMRTKAILEEAKNLESVMNVEVRMTDPAEKIKNWTNDLGSVGIMLPDQKPPAGPATPVSSGTVVTPVTPVGPATGTPLQQARADAQAALDKMKVQVGNASSQYEEFSSKYGARCADGKHPKCDSFMTAARNNHVEMGRNKDEVAKYVGQLKENKGDDGKPLTPEDITRINSRIAAINREMDPAFPESLPRRFEANINNAATEVGAAAVKPPQKPPADQVNQKPPAVKPPAKPPELGAIKSEAGALITSFPRNAVDPRNNAELARLRQVAVTYNNTLQALPKDIQKVRNLLVVIKAKYDEAERLKTYEGFTPPANLQWTAKIVNVATEKQILPLAIHAKNLEVAQYVGCVKKGNFRWYGYVVECRRGPKDDYFTVKRTDEYSLGSIGDPCKGMAGTIAVGPVSIPGVVLSGPNKFSEYNGWNCHQDR